MIIIDTREGKLIELIKNTTSFTIPYEVKNLQIGDIIISPTKYPEKQLIIERKCMTDMICSIKDGRYKEQKLRLKAEESNSQNTKRICYLIEGIINDLRLPNDKTLLYGSIVSSTFRDNIPLLRTNSLGETLDIIIRIHERMNKDITDFFSCKDINIKNNNNNNNNNTNNNNTNNTNNNINITPITLPTPELNTINDNDNTTILTNTILEPSINISQTLEINLQNKEDSNTLEIQEPNNLYLQSIKKCKKENLTPKIWNQIALTNIPGISTTIAIKINEHYPSIRNLLQAYDNCSNEEESIKLISEIILTESEKQKRRIGTVISKRIYEYLYLDI